ncbi:MAG: hypothetical protein Ta2A_23080 [Treponemataceae bacterium]|nr:MAG: hypothetical protein Ta2A_23080 [Treponemataceae bacterium]
MLKLLKDNKYLILFSVPSFFVSYCAESDDYGFVSKYISVFNIFVILLIIVFLIKNIQKDKVLNFAAFLLIPYFVNLCFLNINNIWILDFYEESVAIGFVNSIFAIPSFFAAAFVGYLPFCIFGKSNVICIFGKSNVNFGIAFAIICFLVSIVINVITKYFINAKYNQFNNDNDRKIIIFLSFLQSSSYILLLYRITAPEVARLA